MCTESKSAERGAAENIAGKEEMNMEDRKSKDRKNENRRIEDRRTEDRKNEDWKIEDRKNEHGETEDRKNEDWKIEDRKNENRKIEDAAKAADMKRSESENTDGKAVEVELCRAEEVNKSESVGSSLGQYDVRSKECQDEQAFSDEQRSNAGWVAGQLPYEQMHVEQAACKAAFFRILYLPSLLYAVVYTVCMYRNGSGITMPVWVAAAILYACVVMRKLGRERGEEGNVMPDQKLKNGSGIYIVIMSLLGISTCMTDNRAVIIFNYIGFFMVLIAFLLHNFYDDSKWEFAKGMVEIAAAVLGAVGCMLTPFCDGIAFYQEKKVQNNHTLRAVCIGLACAVPLLAVLGACLMDADAVFDLLISRLCAGFHVPVSQMYGIAMLLFGFFSSYCGMRVLARGTRNAGTAQVRKFDPVIALTFTGCIACMYLVFCMIQVAYLFAGNLKLPEGMTYSAYAHNGFFQLLFVCAVNLCMVLLVQKYFLNHKMLNWMLVVICGCTYIMIASSAYRMILYISTYQLTFLRVLVLVVLGVLALLMAGVLLLIYNPGFPLFRYSMIVVSVIYLGFSFSHVDYFIASYNLSHAGEHTDWWYLSGLSLDAAPAVADYYADAPMERKDKMDLLVRQILDRYERGNEADDFESTGYDTWEYEQQLATGWYHIYMNRVFYAQKNMGLRNFNVSRFMAVKMLADGADTAVD